MGTQRIRGVRADTVLCTFDFNSARRGEGHGYHPRIHPPALPREIFSKLSCITATNKSYYGNAVNIYFLMPTNMKLKRGRPPLPKGVSKDAQVGARFDADDKRSIEKAIVESGGQQTKSQFVRDAARLVAASSVWCKAFSVEELDGKTVTFKIRLKDGSYVEGGGKLMALMRGNGSMKIQIESRKINDAPDTFYRFLMRQESVPWLKKLPQGSKFDFEIKDPTF